MPLQFGAFQVQRIGGVEEQQPLSDGRLGRVEGTGSTVEARGVEGGVLELDDLSLGDLGRPGYGEVLEWLAGTSSSAVEVMVLLP